MALAAQKPGTADRPAGGPAGARAARVLHRPTEGPGATPGVLGSPWAQRSEDPEPVSGGRGSQRRPPEGHSPHPCGLVLGGELGPGCSPGAGAGPACPSCCCDHLCPATPRLAAEGRSAYSHHQTPTGQDTAGWARERGPVHFPDLCPHSCSGPPCPPPGGGVQSPVKLSMPVALRPLSLWPPGPWWSPLSPGIEPRSRRGWPRASARSEGLRAVCLLLKINICFGFRVSRVLAVFPLVWEGREEGARASASDHGV